MYVCNLQTDITKENKAYTYLSIGVVLDEEIKEIDRHFFKGNAAVALIELSQKRSGKKFEYVCELKTEKSKRNTEYTYLSIGVPIGDKIVEVDRHFFASEAAIELIALSEEQYPISIEK